LYIDPWTSQQQVLPSLPQVLVAAAVATNWPRFL
jgi:hypothetical protein